MSVLTKAYVNEIFYYKEGKLYWRAARGRKTKSGSLAGYLHKATGRMNIMIDGKMYKYHRVIYLMHHGVMPEYIDHIDGDKLNNRIENLRKCTSSQNNYNRRLQSNNKSGVKGVYWSKRCKKWIARISVNKKQVYLGLHESIDSAKKAVRSGRKIHHKEFANHGEVS